MMEPIYQLKNKPMPWGDYGDILLSGMTGHRGRNQNGQLQLERTGPFLPPMFISDMNDLIVTESIRQLLQSSSLHIGGMKFTPVVKKHIVSLQWETWDMSLEDPKEYPDDGEPERYILNRPHNQNIANQCGDIWEVTPSAFGDIVREQIGDALWHSNRYLKISSVSYDIFIPNSGSTIFATRTGKEWIEINTNGWIIGDICKTNEKGLYVVHEWNMKACKGMKAKRHPLNSVPYIQNDVPKSDSE